MKRPISYTVITICRNAAETLARTVESVFVQRPLPGQYIFVDADSTDGTPAILRQARRDGRAAGVDVRVLRQPTPPPGEAGIPTAWNCALEHAAGQVVALLNADDWYEAGTVSKVLDLFAESPGPDIVSVPVRLCGSDGLPLGTVLRPRSLLWLPVLMPLPHPGMFVRRGVYHEVGLFDPTLSISADYDFVYRCRRAGKRIGYGSEPLVNMQIGGLAAQRRGVARYETLTVARRYCKLLGLPEAAFALRTLLGR